MRFYSSIRALLSICIFLLPSGAFAMCCEALTYVVPEGFQESFCSGSEVTEVAVVGEFLVARRSDGSTTIETRSEDPQCLANADFDFVGVGVSPGSEDRPVQYLFAETDQFTWSFEQRPGGFEIVILEK